LNKLDHLYLMDNNLERALLDLPVLKNLIFLNLRNTDLKTLDYEKFKTNFPKLRHINLSENKFECLYLAKVLIYLAENEIILNFYLSKLNHGLDEINEVQCHMRTNISSVEKSPKADQTMIHQLQSCREYANSIKLALFVTIFVLTVTLVCTAVGSVFYVKKNSKNNAEAEQNHNSNLDSIFENCIYEPGCTFRNNDENIYGNIDNFHHNESM
jgi:hypothetical protein